MEVGKVNKEFVVREIWVSETSRSHDQLMRQLSLFGKECLFKPSWYDRRPWEVSETNESSHIDGRRRQGRRFAWTHWGGDELIHEFRVIFESRYWAKKEDKTSVQVEAIAQIQLLGVEEFAQVGGRSTEVQALPQ